MVLKLYAHENSSRTQKVLIAAKYAGLTVEPVYDVDTKSADFLSKNPAGKVPVLDTDKGAIFESNAIVRFIAREGKAGLYGKSNIDAGLIDQWVDFAASEIELAAYAWIFPIQGLIPNHPAATGKAQSDVKKVLSILDHHLLTRTYLVGNRVTLADIVVATSLLQLYQLVLDPAARKEFTNTNRWFTTVVNQPEFSAVVGQVKLCDKAAVAPAAPKEKKEKAPKEEKPKEVKPQPKKEEKPKKEKEEKEDDGEEDYEDKEDKKKKNPLDDLPKSNFVLDEWKRMYSNNDTRSVALPWLFANFDPQGFSIWFCDYKYNSELTKVFMTSNLINGFFQRLEKLHKYAFGSMVIFGEEPNTSVSGCWIFRGTEIPPDMLACDDTEHYTWTKGSLDNPEQKKMLEDMFAWDGEFGGKKFNAAKVFK